MTAKSGEIPPPLPSQTPGRRSVVGRCRHHLSRLGVFDKAAPRFLKETCPLQHTLSLSHTYTLTHTSRCILLCQTILRSPFWLHPLPTFTRAASDYSDSCFPHPAHSASLSARLLRASRWSRRLEVDSVVSRSLESAFNAVVDRSRKRMSWN